MPKKKKTTEKRKKRINFEFLKQNKQKKLKEKKIKSRKILGVFYWLQGPRELTT